MNKYNMEPLATSAKELAEVTDVGFIQGCNWDKHLDYALPFVELGKPVFLDKPMVGSVKDVKRVRELVKNGAKIIGSSSARYAVEIQELLALPVEERGEVVAVYAESGVDEFYYSVHAGEILSEIAGAKGVSCKQKCIDIFLTVLENTHDVYIKNIGKEIHDAFLGTWREDGIAEIENSVKVAAENGRGYVAKDNDKVIGFIFFRMNDKKLGTIGRNAVNPDYHGKGIGKMLYDKAIEDLRNDGCKYLTVHTGLDDAHAPARRAYERAGFNCSLPSIQYYQKL